MSSDNTNTLDSEGAEPLIELKPRLSKIWILPIVAVIIGVGMVYNNWQNRGIGIEITFETAEGLEADKTVVKYRNVDIGLVHEIGFSQDRKSIVVGIEIDKTMHELLDSDSQFWVVKPRIGAEGISGIGTILSGSYIELSPGASNSFADRFVGLETPPITTLNDAGLHLTLTSTGGQSISVGDPIVYRGFNVGKVESYEFNAQDREASYGVFIKAPYDALVTSNTFFWNAGGVSINATAQGMKVNIASIEALIGGGVQFDVPEDLEPGENITANRSFTLYDSLDSVENRREYKYFSYAMLVEDSVGGLYKGAPVEYRGIRIGTVESPHLNFDISLSETNSLSKNPRIPVIIRIEPERVYHAKDIDINDFKKIIDEGIKDGLVATIEMANLLTGTLKVSLDFVAEPVTKMETLGSYDVIPTKRGGIASISEKIDSVLSKLEKLPLETTVNNANRAIDSADGAILTFEQSLKEFQLALQGFQPDSEIYKSLDKSMIDLQTTLKSVQPLVKELSNKPNSLIFGRAQQADIEPSIKPKVSKGEPQ